jgi:hypothetical protein
MGADFFRRADWLDAGRVRGYLRLVAVLNLFTLAGLLVTSRGGVDHFGHLIGTDFLSFWTASDLLHAGGNVYDSAAHIAAQRRIHASPTSYTAFFYPPVFLLFCYPLALLGYFPAIIGWLAVTGAGFAATARAWLGRLEWHVFAAFPPVLLTIAHGQTSFLSAALLAGGAWLVPRFPITAGALFGLAVFKPQFGLLIPLVLLLTREWRVFQAAAVTAIALAVAATLLFGMDIWLDWLALSGPATQAMENGAIGFAKMQSFFAAAMLAGLPLRFAYALQFLVDTLVVVALVKMCWRQKFSLEIGSAMILGALLTTPFVLDYDLLLLAFPLAYLATRPVLLPWEKITMAAAFIAPAFARPLAIHTGISLAPLLLLALFFLLVRRSSAFDRHTQRAA